MLQLLELDKRFKSYKYSEERGKEKNGYRISVTTWNLLKGPNRHLDNINTPQIKSVLARINSRWNIAEDWISNLS